MIAGAMRDAEADLGELTKSPLDPSDGPVQIGDPAALLRAFFSRFPPLWSFPVLPSSPALDAPVPIPPVFTLKGSSSDSCPGSFLTRSFHIHRRS